MISGTLQLVTLTYVLYLHCISLIETGVLITQGKIHASAIGQLFLVIKNKLYSRQDILCKISSLFLKQRSIYRFGVGGGLRTEITS